MTETTETIAMRNDINATDGNEASQTATDPIKTIDQDNLKAGDLAIQLKHCRTQADLSIQQAAEEMRLPVTTLSALEAEDLEALPESPYVRGYLRGYARLNDSDASLLIRTYEHLRGANVEDVSFSPATSLNRVAQPPLSPSTIKVIALGILIVLLGILWLIPGVSHWASDTWNSFSQQTTAPQPLNTPVAVVDGPISRDGSASTRDTTEITTANINDITLPGNSSPEAADTSTSSSEPEGGASTDAVRTPDNSVNATSNRADNPVTDDNSTTEQPTERPIETPSNADSSAATPDSSVDSPAHRTVNQTTDSSTNNISRTNSADNTDAIGQENSPATSSTVATDRQTATVATDADAANTANTPTVTAPGTDATPLTTAGTQSDPIDPVNSASLSPEATAPPSTQTPVDFTQPINGYVTVRLEFSQESWTQVKDSRGRPIFEALNSANTWKSFKARTPLSFVVGNAPNVKVYFNGQLYNQAPYTRGSVARFTVN